MLTARTGRGLVTRISHLCCLGAPRDGGFLWTNHLTEGELPFCRLGQTSQKSLCTHEIKCLSKNMPQRQHFAPVTWPGSHLRTSPLPSPPRPPPSEFPSVTLAKSYTWTHPWPSGVFASDQKRHEEWGFVPQGAAYAGVLLGYGRWEGGVWGHPLAAGEQKAARCHCSSTTSFWSSNWMTGRQPDAGGCVFRFFPSSNWVHFKDLLPSPRSTAEVRNCFSGHLEM